MPLVDPGGFVLFWRVPFVGWWTFLLVFWLVFTRKPRGADLIGVLRPVYSIPGTQSWFKWTPLKPPVSSRASPLICVSFVLSCLGASQSRDEVFPCGFALKPAAKGLTILGNPIEHVIILVVFLMI